MPTELLIFLGGVVALLLAAACIVAALRRPAPTSATQPSARARSALLVDSRRQLDAGPGPASTASAAEPAAIADLRLVRETQLDPAQRESIARQLRALAMPPVGLQRLVSADVMAAAGARELGELVMAEPRLAARILARANSAFYGPQSPIRSIPHAITYLGMPTVRSMALGLLLAESFPAADPALRRYSERTWAGALMAADLCNLLGPKLGLPETGVLGTHAILAFLGELALPALTGSAPDLEGQHGLVERYRREQQQLGVSSALLGTILMQEWRLPAPMIREVEAVGRLVVTPADPTDPRRAGQRGLVYACARLGEAIARGRVGHPAQLSVTAGSDAEFHHLQSYLRLPTLARLPDLLARPETAAVLARMIAADRLPSIAA